MLSRGRQKSNTVIDEGKRRAKSIFQTPVKKSEKMISSPKPNIPEIQKKQKI
jgi:hypothetical protein